METTSPTPEREFWTRQFNRDSQVLGRSLTLNGVPHTIVGILPPQPVVFFGEIRCVDDEAALEGWVLGRSLRTTLWMLLGAVGLVLLIAISNVANLLLVQFSARRREVALRLALGGDRGRIMRLFLTESLLVSLLAAALGVGIARLSLKVLLSVNPPLPVGREIELSPWVLLKPRSSASSATCARSRCGVSQISRSTGR